MESTGIEILITFMNPTFMCIKKTCSYLHNQEAKHWQNYHTNMLWACYTRKFSSLKITLYRLFEIKQGRTPISSVQQICLSTFSQLLHRITWITITTTNSSFYGTMISIFQFPSTHRKQKQVSVHTYYFFASHVDRNSITQPPVKHVQSVGTNSFGEEK